jgi:hypothetical protein
MFFFCWKFLGENFTGNYLEKRIILSFKIDLYFLQTKKTARFKTFQFSSQFKCQKSKLFFIKIAAKNSIMSKNQKNFKIPTSLKIQTESNHSSKL